MRKLLLIPVVSLLFALQLSAQVRFDKNDSVPVEWNGQPLPNAWAGGINFPLFSSIDLNGDSIMDVVLYDRLNNRLSCFTNDGSASVNAWHYAPQFASRFPALNRWMLSYDYNCDGKMDLFTLSPLYPSCIACYRNDYTPGTGLQFTLVDPILEESFSTTSFPIFASGVLIPAFDDIDGDGDMDILGYNSIPDGRIIYHKNESKELFGHCDSLKFTYADACWGTFALAIGGNNEVGCFNCPCRMSSSGPVEKSADFNLGPEEMRRDDTITSIFPIDIDGDLDKDLLVGDISALTSLLVINGGTPSAANMIAQDATYPTADVPAIFNGFHYHASFDTDNDGLKDLIISPSEYENKQAMWLYRNFNTASMPDFQLTTTTFLQDQMIDVGENAAPVPFDYDSDGLEDLIVAGSVYDTATSAYRNSLFLFRNTGTATSPSFNLINEDVAGIASLAYNSTIYPSFGDIDNDGDKDMILGTEDGRLQYFSNTAGPGNPANFQLNTPNYMGIDVGNNATPQLVDIDRDAKLDLIIGEKSGFVNFYKNIGSATSPFFSNIASEDTLGGINLQQQGYTDGYTVPFMYDSAGSYRLAVSNMTGNVYFYGNIDGNILGTYTLIDSLYEKSESSRIRFNVSVSGGSFNGDSYTDLVIGQSTGGLQLWMQHNPTAGVQQPNALLPSFVAFPNPASDRFIIDVNAIGKDRSLFIRVHNAEGRLMKEVPLDSQRIQVETADWPEGIYLIQLAGSGVSRSQKVMVLHR